jgi:outer membrane protein OmpA-like peptidoglycan-associated protein
MSRSQKTGAAISTLLAALLLTACATPQPPPPELVRARLTLGQAEGDPSVAVLAPLELKRASESLGRANRLLDNGRPLDEVSSAAHVADQQAHAAIAIAQAKGNDVAISGAALERERIRADTRSAEARQAQAESLSSQDQARSARDQAHAAQERALSAQDRATTAQAQTDDARRQASAADNRATGAEQRATGAEQRATGAEERATGAEQRATGLEERASGAEQQSSAAIAAMAGAQIAAAELQKKIDALQAKPTERGLLVTLGDVLFETNKSEVRPAAQNSLHKLADFLQANPKRFVLIEGHTDNVGSAAYNEALSLRRANAVDSALSQLGVPTTRMDTAGYGEAYPVADNMSDSSRALNRRVEVYIAEDDQPVKARH